MDSRDSNASIHWRARLSATHQLVTLSNIISPEEFVEYLLPVFATLCRDPVYQVRLQAAQQVGRSLAVVEGQFTIFSQHFMDEQIFAEAAAKLQEPHVPVLPNGASLPGPRDARGALPSRQSSGRASTPIPPN